MFYLFPDLSELLVTIVVQTQVMFLLRLRYGDQEKCIMFVSETVFGLFQEFDGILNTFIYENKVKVRHS